MSVVRGSGVGVVLHSCSRFVVGGLGMLGSPTMLLDKGFLSRSSLSESLSSGRVNHPLRFAVGVSGGLASKGGARVRVKLNLCYDFAGFRWKAKSVVHWFRLFALRSSKGLLFKAEDVE